MGDAINEQKLFFENRTTSEEAIGFKPIKNEGNLSNEMNSK
jgi:hypothetical protein